MGFHWRLSVFNGDFSFLISQYIFYGDYGLLLMTMVFMFFYMGFLMANLGFYGPLSV